MNIQNVMLRSRSLIISAAAFLCSSAAHAEQDESPPSSEAIENESTWSWESMIGGHLTLPGKELRKTSDPVALGFHFSGGARYKDLPLLIGGDFGFDLFLPRTVLLSDGGSETYWDVSRQDMWLAPSIRLTPRSWVIRPYVDVFAGLWIHWVNLKRDSTFEAERSDTAATAATGLLGFGTGLTWKLNEKLNMGVSSRYMRGSGIELPKVALIDGQLYYSKERSDSIQQWLFGMDVGGRF